MVLAFRLSQRRHGWPRSLLQFPESVSYVLDQSRLVNDLNVLVRLNNSSQSRRQLGSKISRNRRSIFPDGLRSGLRNVVFVTFVVGAKSLWCAGRKRRR